MIDRARQLRARAMVEEMTSPAYIFAFGELTWSEERRIRDDIARAVRACRPGIALHINSRGGFIAAADGIARDLAGVGLPVRAHVHFLCSSAAVTVLLAAAERSASHSAQFFLHPAHVRAAEIGDLTAKELRARAARLELDDRRYDTMLSSAGLPDHIIAAARRKAGITLHAREAYAFGLVHRLTGR